MDRNERIASLIKIEGVSEEEIASLLSAPKDLAFADVALPCFRFAKALRKSPVQIAEELAAKISQDLPPYLLSCAALNGYLNFKFSRENMAKDTLLKVLREKENYGKSDLGKGKTICIDFSSVNIAKPFHIGHLSSTVIGGALSRIFSALGYTVVRINHLGDWGTQFGKMIVAYKKWGEDADIEKGGVKALHKLYVRFHQEAEQDESLNDLGRHYFKLIEDGDKEALALFERFKAVSLAEAKRVYDRLGIDFDSYAGESFYNDKMQPVLDKLEEKGLLVESDGAKIVDVGDDMPPCLLVRSDGATLYATRDLAAAYYRKKTYDFYKCLYVVAYQQNLHFKQVFKVLELLGEPWAKDLEHVNFGMVSLVDGTMSSRQGKVVYLEDVLNSAVEKAKSIIEEKNPNLEKKDEIAEEVGVGAVIFGALINNRIKDITFSYDKVLNFDGETCPYVQYTHARCASLIEKAGGFDIEKADFSALENAHEIISAISSFEDMLRSAAEKREPSVITRHAVDLAELFNKYYIDNRILNAEESVKNARLALTFAVKQVLANSLTLLGIAAPNKM
ncbi:MAG: arginine--tRNA ligase [Clostridia bacterium]|nr:arginine--tRNA ligase [Clostridia bacterium]